MFTLPKFVGKTWDEHKHPRVHGGPHGGEFGHGRIASRPVQCERCGGAGIIDKFRHVEGGTCFECSGSGFVPHGHRYAAGDSHRVGKPSPPSKLDVRERIGEHPADSFDSMGYAHSLDKKYLRDVYDKFASESRERIQQAVENVRGLIGRSDGESRRRYTAAHGLLQEMLEKHGTLSAKPEAKPEAVAQPKKDADAPVSSEKRPRPKRGEVALTDENGEPFKTVSADLINDDLAVHRGESGIWTVTHRPSGVAMVSFLNKTEATEAAYKLAAMKLPKWRKYRELSDEDATRVHAAIRAVKPLSSAKSFRLTLLTKAGQFRESLHPRGQPKNRGQFKEGAGGGGSGGRTAPMAGSSGGSGAAGGRASDIRSNPLLESLFAQPEEGKPPPKRPESDMRHNPQLDALFGIGPKPGEQKPEAPYKPEDPMRAPGTGKPPKNLGSPNSTEEARDQLIWLMGRASLLRKRGREERPLTKKETKELTLSLNLASRLSYGHFRLPELPKPAEQETPAADTPTRYPSRHNPEITYGHEDDRDSDDAHFDRQIQAASRKIERLRSQLAKLESQAPAALKGELDAINQRLVELDSKREGHADQIANLRDELAASKKRQREATAARRKPPAKTPKREQPISRTPEPPPLPKRATETDTVVRGRNGRITIQSRRRTGKSFRLPSL